ncbi:hypothetical protein FDO65_08670 [Nakamurella flava]|uniref:ABC transporter permease n=1 Tax=Nakamurella flava TaxID=2576308 RepID=A0A4U6QN57_9ACTN|nr:hypothetical protein [Nakamurella flava]TKV61618.1 hypothetical protein FDO65_08670 [Nakamurella flava]
MSLLAAERIKLGTTRSPYWCIAAVAAGALLFSLITALNQSGRFASTTGSLIGVDLSLSIFMVLAALSVTTEYRFNTIRSTFLAAPRRVGVLVAKSVVVGLLGLVVGAVMALAAFFLAQALAKDPATPLTLSTAEQWRQVLGWGPIFAIAGVLAVAVGVIVRQSAGAIAIVLIWPLALEGLLKLIPGVADSIGPYLPFTAGRQFVADGPNLDPSPWVGLGVFAAWTAVIWLLAAALLRGRDA